MRQEVNEKLKSTPNLKENIKLLQCAENGWSPSQGRYELSHSTTDSVLEEESRRGVAAVWN
jgi:hypothetical protein